MDERIRRARAMAQMTQVALAERVGVQRSAVAQWESRAGSRPSMENLIAIALHTGVRLEWLGTGRGPIPTVDTIDSLAEQGRADDALEMHCLCLIRKLPRRLRNQIVGVLRAMVP